MVSYLQAVGISRRIGDNLLFENVNININKDDKTAIVGVNGSGKSTLLEIISGIEKPDSGSVNKIRGLSISMLAQEPVLDTNKTIIEELLNTGGKLASLVCDYEKSLLSGDNKLIAGLVQKMDDNKAWDYEVMVKQVLFRLNLQDIYKKIDNLSGGERKRVALAKAIVEESDLLILDEPTNHLDLDMIEWLEEYLEETTRTVLMVTHDRYFLDRVCNNIIEISGKTTSSYNGNYSYYVAKKQEKELAAAANAERVKNLYRRELDWMRRMPKARTHKSKSRTDAFYELAEANKGSSNEQAVSINVRTERMGKKILEIRGISKSFGGRKVIDNFSYQFSRFEKAGLVGKNGSGKTTLLNIISNRIEPDEGSLELGSTIKIGYYRQEGINFDGSKTVFEAASEIAEKVILNDGNSVSVSQFMNYFLFPPDRQRTLIRKLSGGEKRRLYLLTVLMQNPNFLLLDEPTNDLDILTLNVLEEYLSDFPGCVLVASHDRYFMDKVVDHTFEYREGGLIKDFPGNYTQLRNATASETASREKSQDTSVKKIKDTEDPLLKKKKPGLTYKEKMELEKVEKQISELMSEKGEIETFLSSGDLKSSVIIEKSERLGVILNELENLEMRWLELNDR